MNGKVVLAPFHFVWSGAKTQATVVVRKTQGMLNSALRSIQYCRNFKVMPAMWN